MRGWDGGDVARSLRDGTGARWSPCGASCWVARIVPVGLCGDAALRGQGRSGSAAGCRARRPPGGVGCRGRRGWEPSGAWQAEEAAAACVLTPRLPERSGGRRSTAALALFCFLLSSSCVWTKIAKIPNRKLPLPPALWLLSHFGRFCDSAAQMEPSLTALSTKSVYCSRGCFSESSLLCVTSVLP